MAKENPEAFARLALGVIPREHEGLPPSVVVYTGVPRAEDSYATLPSPPAALPAPKKPEPEAVACPITTEDMVAELPEAPEPAKAEAPKTEKLIYPKIVPRIGWR